MRILCCFIQPKCNINSVDNQKRTALHLAIIRGHVATIEKLVGYGIDINITSSIGNTALHETLRLSNMAMPSSCTPEIKKVHR